MDVPMPDHASRPQSDRRLASRPKDVVAAEQKRHDRAVARGLTAFFSVLFVGGGLAFFIALSPLFRGLHDLQAVLICVVFFAPLLASLIALASVPPLPFEALGDANREMDQKLAVWRGAMLSQIIVFSSVVVETFWLWPRFVRLHGWPFLMPNLVSMLFMVSLVISSLYIRPGWLDPDLRPFLDDEVTRSFRARAQRLGYILVLFILLGLGVLAQINAQAAAHYMPLGLAVGGALPVLYFVYLDWRASRGG
jgi:hypothetical protein